MVEIKFLAKKVVSYILSLLTLMATVVASQIFGIITYSNGLYLVMIISHEKGVSYRGVARVGRDKGLSPPTTIIIYLKYIYFIVCQIHEHIY